MRQDTAGKTVAQDMLDEALRLQLGLGVDADERGSLALFCQAARLGDRNAILTIVGWLLTELGPDYDAELAADWLHRLQTLQRGRPLPRTLAVLRCPAESLRAPIHALASLASTVEQLATSAGLDPILVKSVIAVESNWNPAAVSPVGAMGLMQLMPSTALRLAVTDPLDAEQNIRGGITELRRLLGVYAGNVELALAAYNAGERVVNGCHCIPDNGETPEYVRRVLQFMVPSSRPSP